MIETTLVMCLLNYFSNWAEFLRAILELNPVSTMKFYFKTIGGKAKAKIFGMHSCVST